MAAETLDVSSMIPVKFENKRQSQWILQIEGIDAYLLKSAARPDVTTEEIEIPWINSTRYVPGKTKFGVMAITLHDPIAPSAAQQMMEWIRVHFECVSGRSGYTDFLKRDIALKLLDPIGVVVELWDIKGAFLTEVKFGELKYEGNRELVEISCNLRYDLAVLQF